jgi:hypothetical protein
MAKYARLSQNRQMKSWAVEGLLGAPGRGETGVPARIAFRIGTFS